MFPIYPLADRLFVKRMEAKSKTGGGLFIPEQAKEKPMFGKVVAMGPSCKDPNLQENVMVLYGRYAGTEVTVHGEEILLMAEEEVLGIIVDRGLAESFLADGV